MPTKYAAEFARRDPVGPAPVPPGVAEDAVQAAVDMELDSLEDLTTDLLAGRVDTF